MSRGLPGRDRGEVLVEMALQLGAVPDLDHVLPLALRRITELLEADRALFALYDDEGRVTRAVTHNLEWAGPPAPLPISSSLANQVHQTGELTIVHDEEESTLSLAPSVVNMQLRFLMGVPVHSARGLIGLIYIDSTAAMVAIQPKLREFIIALSRLVATAVEQARLFEEQRFRRRLLGSLVHDLRTPLSVINANVGVMHGEIGASELAEMRDDILAACRWMSRIVANTLELSIADDEGATGVPPRFGIEAALEQHLGGLEPVARQHEVELKLVPHGRLGPVQALETWVWIMVDNLVFWALRHARRGTAIAFTLCERDDAGPSDDVADEVQLFSRLETFEPVRGTGFVGVTMTLDAPGFGAAEAAQLFRLRAQSGVSGYGNGQAASGLGMSIVRQCAQRLGGQAWAEPTSAGFACHFALPREVVKAPSRLLGSSSELEILLAEPTLESGRPTERWATLHDL